MPRPVPDFPSPLLLPTTRPGSRPMEVEYKVAVLLLSQHSSRFPSAAPSPHSTTRPRPRTRPRRARCPAAPPPPGPRAAPEGPSVTDVHLVWGGPHGRSENTLSWIPRSSHAFIPRLHAEIQLKRGRVSHEWSVFGYRDSGRRMRRKCTGTLVHMNTQSVRERVAGPKRRMRRVTVCGYTSTLFRAHSQETGWWPIEGK